MDNKTILLKAGYFSRILMITFILLLILTFVQAAIFEISVTSFSTFTSWPISPLPLAATMFIPSLATPLFNISTSTTRAMRSRTS